MALSRTFFQVSITEQCRRLYLEGEFIMAIRYYQYKINLYHFGDSLIEVFYNHKLAKIHKIQPLDYGSSRMKFYADQINLSELTPPQDNA